MAYSPVPSSDIIGLYGKALFVSRRSVLMGAASAGIITAVRSAGFPTEASAAGIPKTGDKGQDQWRFCNKCDGLFYDGYSTKGVCPAGGGHVSQGFIFVLPFNTAAASDTQADWRFCNKCNGMFFDGFKNNKTNCPAGGGHVAQGYNFVLHHDTETNLGSQSDWRGCNKCSGMFYDGYPQKGHCPAGGGHVAQGYNFVLSHPADLPSGSNVSAGGGASQPKLKYCTDYTCAACKRDGLQCSQSIQCPAGPDTGWACY